MTYIEEISVRNSFDSKIFRPGGIIGDRSSDKNFTLTLYLRVYLLQRNPANGKQEETMFDGSNLSHKIQKWDQASWRVFCDEYLRQSNECWDRAFLLKTPDGYRGFDYPETGNGKKQRNVRCRFLISLTDSPSEAHAIIPVLRTLGPGFRSHSKLYSFHDKDGEDLISPGQSVRWRFFTIPHEVGHLLGLGHPNDLAKECVLHPNSSICYVGKFEHRLQVQGTGSSLALEYAEPWQKRIAQHTKMKTHKEWKAQWLSDEAAFRGTEHVTLLRPGA